MARDRSYGSGYNNTGMPRYTTTSVSQGQTGFHIRDDANEWSLNFGGLQLLGIQKGSVASQQARTVAQTGGTRPIGQLVRDITGVGYDSKGKFGVDPVGLAMAWTPAKIAKFGRLSKSVRESTTYAGQIERALDQGSRIVHRYPENAYEALADRAHAANLGKTISRIMAEFKLKSEPNVNLPTMRNRDLYRSVEESIPASMSAQQVARVRNPGSLYPSGVPSGGWVESPNLRRMVPQQGMRYTRYYPEKEVMKSWGATRYRAERPGDTPKYSKEIIDSSLTEAQREASASIAGLLDEAIINRNLSAGIKAGGEYFFPRTWQPYNFTRPMFGRIRPSAITRFAGEGSEAARFAPRLDPAAYQAEVMDFIRGKAAAAAAAARKRRLK